MNESLTIMNTEHTKAYLDVLFGRKTVDEIQQEFDLPPLSEPVVEEPTEFITKNDAMFSIFPDDENPEDIRIEILPDFVWNKEDIWELVAELLEKVGSIDKEGNILDDNDPDLNIDTANIRNLTASGLILNDGTFFTGNKLILGDGSSIYLKNGRYTFEAEPLVFEDDKFKINTTVDNIESIYREVIKDIDLSSLEEELGHMHNWTGENVSNIINTINSLQERIKNLEKKEENKPKKLLILTAPGNVSDETVSQLKEHVQDALDKANNDSVPLVIANGLHAYFLDA